MMKSVLSVLLVCVVAGVFAQPPRYSLNPQEVLEYVSTGGIITYDIDASKCDVRLPPSIRNHSFGDVARDAYVEYSAPGQWRMYTSSARPVNGSHVNVTGSVLRVTGFDLTPSDEKGDDGTAFISMADYGHGGSQAVLAEGNMTCKYSMGGFAAHPQRIGDRQLGNEREVLEAFYFGLEMTFAVDLSRCTRSGARRDAAPSSIGGKLYADSQEGWTGDISGFRFGDTPNTVEFTSVLEGPKQRDVFKVRVSEASPGATSLVEIRSYVENHGPNPAPGVETVYSCAMGQQGQFHVFTYTPK